MCLKLKHLNLYLVFTRLLTLCAACRSPARAYSGSDVPLELRDYFSRAGLHVALAQPLVGHPASRNGGSSG
jgi:hypothetical protein